MKHCYEKIILIFQTKKSVTIISRCLLFKKKVCLHQYFANVVFNFNVFATVMSITFISFQFLYFITNDEVCVKDLINLIHHIVGVFLSLTV